METEAEEWSNWDPEEDKSDPNVTGGHAANKRTEEMLVQLQGQVSELRLAEHTPPVEQRKNETYAELEEELEKLKTERQTGYREFSERLKRHTEEEEARH